jgi:hypothetical protein
MLIARQYCLFLICVWICVFHLVHANNTKRNTPNSTQVLPHKTKPACSFRFLAYCADVMQREEEKRVKEKRGA